MVGFCRQTSPPEMWSVTQVLVTRKTALTPMLIMTMMLRMNTNYAVLYSIQHGVISPVTDQLDKFSGVEGYMSRIIVTLW